MLNRLTSSSGFLANISAYAIAEGLGKVTRLVTVVALARFLGPESLGLAALALTIGEVFRAFTENGVGQRIIAAKDDDLQKVTNTAYLLFWGWSCLLFTLQVLVGVYLWSIGYTSLLILLLTILALPYLAMPAGLIHCFLAMRANKLKSTATVAATQNVTSNLLTAFFVALWPIPLSVVLPKFFTAPLWVFMMRRLTIWHFNKAEGFVPVSYFLAFSGSVLGIEVMRALRLQADKLIIGGVLGVEALGIYYFAFNAGLGITNSISMAFTTCVFPMLCGKEKGGDRNTAFLKAIGVVLLGLVPLVGLQIALAPYYVPLIFGDKWAGASELVAILCLAAIPMVIWSGTGQWLRAQDRAHEELISSAFITAGLLAMTFVLAPYGLLAIAIGYVITTTVTQLAAALWTARELWLPLTPNVPSFSVDQTRG